MQIKDSKYYIQQRQEGENVLSWIENFGLYLLNDKTNRRFAFEKEDHILVLRIQNDGKEDIISAYYCYFRTSNNGVARFCINSPFDGTEIATKELWNLMVEKAQWNSTQTRKWWEFVFPVGQTVDESILKQKLVVASELTDITMSEFVSSIAAEFEKVIRQLGINKDKYTKVCIVGQYAMALPVLHALRNLFLNRQVNSYVFTKNNPMKEYSWKQNASRFHVPSKLLYTMLNTTAQMTVEDVLDLGENGFFVTLPLSICEDGNYHLPSTSIFKGFALKWNELEKDKAQHDYKAGDLLFKRVQLSMIADGFQTVYIKCDTDIVACSEYENGKYQIKGLSHNKSEKAQKAMVSRPQPTKKSNGVKSVSEITTDPSKNTSTNSPSDEARHQISTLFFDGSDRLIIVARKNIETLFKKKYQDKWEIKMKKTFCKGVYKNLDFGNFPSFITDNKDMLIEYWGGEDSYYQVKNSAYALHKLRNQNNHYEIDAVINQGKAEVSRVFSDMIRVVKIMGDSETAKKIEDLNLKLDTIWWIN